METNLIDSDILKKKVDQMENLLEQIYSSIDDFKENTETIKNGLDN